MSSTPVNPAENPVGAFKQQLESAYDHNPNDVHDTHDHHHHDEEAKVTLGFWIYLMSDCLIFATLFATYAVLKDATAGGPNGRELFDLGFVAIETSLLLLSSLTFGLSMISMQNNKLNGVLGWLAVTGLLGLGFMGMELYEFNHLIHEGAGPDRSAFLSAFFTLVGTHGLHVTSGLIWMGVMFVHLFRRGLTPANRIRMMELSLFWHFLDIIWIGVFSIVYLMGAA
ncbi:cytochrome o ubiquinol oxidase subunit III [Asticcacaulis excentricus]|uniref:Cytochrome bo(3) ubiquinol oxidase subunit 3 n=1 Tax=Asticcacaulis excentricus (strain ATCC 15261 / DSM 4724 / KCTC 12464 / NCIMB 9791 / VKM B-1370 / CB 48) TaxID=573065 RepID=E8RVP4_ASTEC|nr:cytochrome o ubiquinol oxidase subunit III [Asticcacaulis excentricus]ADU15213.1 cytochrome o ubiquinol oxidase, subunit III [Asticcacaulis excentricus CB 48]